MKEKQPQELRSPVFKKRFARRQTTYRPFTFVRNFETQAEAQNQIVKQVGERGEVITTLHLQTAGDGTSITDIVRQSPVPVIIAHPAPGSRDQQTSNRGQTDDDESQDVLAGPRRSRRSHIPSPGFLSRRQYPLGITQLSHRAPDDHYIGSKNDSNIDEEVSFIDEDDSRSSKKGSSKPNSSSKPTNKAPAKVSAEKSITNTSARKGRAAKIPRDKSSIDNSNAAANTTKTTTEISTENISAASGKTDSAVKKPSSAKKGKTAKNTQEKSITKSPVTPDTTKNTAEASSAKESVLSAKTDSAAKKTSITNGSAKKDKTDKTAEAKGITDASVTSSITESTAEKSTAKDSAVSAKTTGANKEKSTKKDSVTISKTSKITKDKIITSDSAPATKTTEATPEKSATRDSAPVANAGTKRSITNNSAVRAKTSRGQRQSPASTSQANPKQPVSEGKTGSTSRVDADSGKQSLLAGKQKNHDSGPELEKTQVSTAPQRMSASRKNDSSVNSTGGSVHKRVRQARSAAKKQQTTESPAEQKKSKSLKKSGKGAAGKEGISKKMVKQNTEHVVPADTFPKGDVTQSLDGSRRNSAKRGSKRGHQQTASDSGEGSSAKRKGRVDEKDTLSSGSSVKRGRKMKLVNADTVSSAQDTGSVDAGGDAGAGRETLSRSTAVASSNNSGRQRRTRKTTDNAKANMNKSSSQDQELSIFHQSTSSSPSAQLVIEPTLGAVGSHTTVREPALTDIIPGTSVHSATRRVRKRNAARDEDESEHRRLPEKKSRGSKGKDVSGQSESRGKKSQSTVSAPHSKSKTKTIENNVQSFSHQMSDAAAFEDGRETEPSLRARSQSTDSQPQTSQSHKSGLVQQEGSSPQKRFFTNSERRTSQMLGAQRKVAMRKSEKGDKPVAASSFWKTSAMSPLRRIDLQDHDKSVSSVYDDETFGEQYELPSVQNKTKGNKDGGYPRTQQQLKRGAELAQKVKRRGRDVTELDVITDMLDDTEADVLDHGDLSKPCRSAVHKGFTFVRKQIQQTLLQVAEVKELTSAVNKLKGHFRGLTKQSRENHQQKCLLLRELQTLKRRGVDVDVMRIDTWLQDFTALRQLCSRPGM